MNIFHEIPSTKEYIDLRHRADLRTGTVTDAATALANSLFCVTLRDELSGLIGMGRIIGDGGCYYQIVDVIVNSDSQDHGSGGMVMRELVGYLDQHASETAEVLVISDLTGLKLYQEYGFKLVYPDFYGMVRKP
ncbi:acetyltransferase (GNAT) family protein [Fontibacillus phaseoli]|uniref:Acetyltransferase (GNAT) family protein n=1 Tax=Fontibacillus phaseoli TaxID=1416533 RepID=A0A369BS01_9BACL|nr:GNAT family N-acetyltransferase [Fontibacillus phaseoli]RCX23825.1 acetyltransferase (GNAT) family protein [Fontibacillus phaseoli]